MEARSWPYGLEGQLRQVWSIHDALEALLTERERNGVRGGLQRYDEAMDLLWQAHDLIERATLKLHALFSPEEIDALQTEKELPCAGASS